MMAATDRLPGPLARLRRPEAATLGIPIMILLAVEFLLGMALNLYTSLGGGSAAAMLASSPVLIVHIVVALMLLGITARALRLAVRSGPRGAVAASALALVSSIVATVAGGSFAFDGQSAAASLAMSLGFTGILLGALFLLIGRRVTTPVAAGAEAVA